MQATIPARCHACGRYCDGCSFSKVYELPQVPRPVEEWTPFCKGKDHSWERDPEGDYCIACGITWINWTGPDDPLAAARGILNGLLFSLLAWAMLLGFTALIYFNVHA